MFIIKNFLKNMKIKNVWMEKILERESLQDVEFSKKSFFFFHAKTILFLHIFFHLFFKIFF